MAKTSLPRLGRGLSSLISSSTPPAQAPATQQPQGTYEPTAAHSSANGEIAVDQISPNPFQPRRRFDEESLANLAASITQQGILQPLVIARAAADAERPYTLVAGERRLRAAQLAGLDTVPCVLRTPSRQQVLEWALVENIQRTDLNPMERAEAYREYIDRFELTQAEAAERLGQPRTTVTNHLRVLDLADEVQSLIRDGRLAFGHAKVLAALIGNPEPQMQLARQVVKDGLSVRQLEVLVAAAQSGQKHVPAPAGKAAPQQSPYLRELEEQLTRTIGTRVRIRGGRAKNAGKIVIDYYNLDDFDRITSALGLDLDS